MCDTLVLRSDGATWFAKNSDREPAEPQRLIRLPAVHGDRAATVRTTYLEIPQTAERHAVILSQPAWMWGAEMGVNERGVAIGNEAVFTRLTLREGEALLGMDLLRLALERAATAREALAVITELLERHGQGGPAGYRNKRMRYDNSYLIADRDEAWVLETAGRLWAAKRVERWAISNALTLGHDYDLASPNLEDHARRLGCWNGRGDFHFARAFDGRVLPWIAGARQRRQLNQDFLAHCPAKVDWLALVVALRSHGHRGHRLSSHDNRQICLHAGSFWRPSQTTASLIARLDGGSTAARRAWPPPAPRRRACRCSSRWASRRALARRCSAERMPPWRSPSGGASKPCTSAPWPTPASPTPCAPATAGWKPSCWPSSTGARWIGRAWPPKPRPGTTPGTSWRSRRRSARRAGGV